jgi:hypothetical protein
MAGRSDLTEVKEISGVHFEGGGPALDQCHLTIHYTDQKSAAHALRLLYPQAMKLLGWLQDLKKSQEPR